MSFGMQIADIHTKIEKSAKHNGLEIAGSEDGYSLTFWFKSDQGGSHSVREYDPKTLNEVLAKIKSKDISGVTFYIPPSEVGY